MKITGLTVHIFEGRKNTHQETPEYAEINERRNGVAIFHTDEGIDGIVSAKANNLRRLVSVWKPSSEIIAGFDALDRGAIEKVLKHRFQWPTNVIGILDNGLWDIAGKYFNQPIYKLVGACREKVPAYGSTVHHATDERFIETAVKCKEMGFRAIKIHPYCVLEPDIQLCYKVRKAVGDDVALMLDTLVYPGPYNREGAIKMARVLDELDFYWFEDPLPKTDLEGLAILRASCKKVQVRAADSVVDVHEYDQMLRRGCMDIIAGPASFGISDLLKLAHLAELHHMNMEPHDFSGGTSSLHVLLSITNGKYYEVAVPRGSLHNMLYPGVYLNAPWIDSEGYIHAPTKPGLGFDIDLKEAEKVTEEKITF